MKLDLWPSPYSLQEITQSQQQPEDVGVVDLGPIENVDETRFENDLIEFIFTFSPEMICYYDENMARQYFSPFFFVF